MVPPWEAALAIAVDRRAELRQQRLSVQQAELRRDVARSDAKPRLDFDLSAASQGYDPNEGEALSNAASFEYPTLRAGLAFSTPIGNTTARNQLAATWADLRAEKLRYDQLETSVLADVRDAVRQAQYQIEAVRAAQKSLELASEQLEAERARLENDQSTVFQVLQFQQELVRAMSVEVLARSNLAKSRTRLEAAQGTLGEAPGQ
jgi:outer membrane protein TolC